jgi:Ca2+-binding EF-hand superfamily protein
MLQYGVPRLSVEDDVFLARVCHLVDQDRSGIIEWDEFLQTVTALEWGSLQVQCRFLIQCYDLDGDGAVGRADLTSIFRHSSMLFSDQEMKRRRLRQELLALAHGFFRPSDQQMLKKYRHEVEDFVAQAVLAQSPEEAAANATADDVVAAFVTQTFKQLGKEGDDATISYTDLVEYVQNHGGDVDVWKLFGRSVVPV